MFSFHKPKIYRSLQGCCICRAKSSSSRFTDSKRYEADFESCFMIRESRYGEICNACVLLVKRWKKLPAGSSRNWHHVVDARAGPGTKSMNKIKNKARDRDEKQVLKVKPKKYKHKKKPAKLIKPPQSPGGLSDDFVVGDDCLSDRSSNSGYLSNSDVSEDEKEDRRKTYLPKRRKPSNPTRFSSFLDLTYWKKTDVCCGTIFKGTNGEVLVDPSLLRPCSACKPVDKCTPPVSDCDFASSDSGVSSQDRTELPPVLDAPAEVLDSPMADDMPTLSIVQHSAQPLAENVLDLSLTPDYHKEYRCIEMEV